MHLFPCQRLKDEVLSVTNVVALLKTLTLTLISMLEVIYSLQND